MMSVPISERDSTTLRAGASSSSALRRRNSSNETVHSSFPNESPLLFSSLLSIARPPQLAAINQDHTRQLTFHIAEVRRRQRRGEEMKTMHAMQGASAEVIGQEGFFCKITLSPTVTTILSLRFFNSELLTQPILPEKPGSQVELQQSGSASIEWIGWLTI